MFDGPRVNATYDPMRKQGAILLGNGGDNSNGSQGTFYEGAMTAAGTFPSDATDQLVQANVVAAEVRTCSASSLAPASATATPPGLSDIHAGFLAGHHVTFTNTTGAPAVGRQAEPLAAQQAVDLRRSGHHRDVEDIRRPGGAGRERERDLQGHLGAGGLQRRPGRQTPRGRTSQRQQAIRDNGREGAEREPDQDQRIPHQLRSPANATDSFIELYNAGAESVDISNWTLTVHPAQQAIFST